jgi:hypothetical protein
MKPPSSKDIIDSFGLSPDMTILLWTEAFEFICANIANYQLNASPKPLAFNCYRLVLIVWRFFSIAEVKHQKAQGINCCHRASIHFRESSGAEYVEI